jgi:hypothetical protein
MSGMGQLTQRVLEWWGTGEAAEALKVRGSSDAQVELTRAGLLQLADMGWFAIDSKRVAQDVGALANILWHSAGVRWSAADGPLARWISVQPDAVLAGWWKVRLSVERPTYVDPRGEAWEFGS